MTAFTAGWQLEGASVEMYWSTWEAADSCMASAHQLCLTGESSAQVWLLKGASDEMYRSMWEAAMDEMAAKLIFSSKKTGLTYIAELQS